MKLIALSIALVASSAHADDRSDAEALFRIGAAAYKNGNFKAAALNFDRAYELFKAPEIAFSAAQAHRHQYQADSQPGHVKRAIELFEIYVAAVPEGSGKRKDALAHLNRLRDLLRDLEAKGGQVVIAPVKDTPSIYVSVALEQALVTVDGKAAERYTALEVAPGEHVVGVSAEGYELIERKVAVTKGQAIVPIELVPKPAQVSIKTAADARLLVDGRPVRGGATLSIPAGQRLLTVYARGREPVIRELELKPGEQRALEVPLRTTTRRRAVPWVWIGGGVLLASTVTTSIVALRADGKASELRDAADPIDRDAAARYEDERGRRDSFRTASYVLGTATLVTAATALWLYYFDNPSSDDLARPTERSSPGLSPMVSGDTVGLSYGGGF
jgi:hypothetical protein